MAEENPPSFMSLVSTEQAYQGRLMLQGLEPYSGNVLGGDMAVTAQGSPNMTVNVAIGGAFILGTQGSTQGAYHVYNNATKVLTVNASDPTNPRWDIVVATVQDQQYSGASNLWLLQVVTGTPGVSPAEPALPANSLKLARIVVPANATQIGPGGAQGSIVDERTFIQRNEQYSSTLVGPPTTGTWSVGDRVRDKNYALWICLVAGTPGTWMWAGGGNYVAQMHLQTTTGAVITSGTAYVVVPYDTVDQDPLGMCTTGASAHFTVPVPGWWSIQGTWTVALPAASTVISNCFAKNNTVTPITATRQQNQFWQNSGQTVMGTVNVVEKLAAGDTVSIGAFQSSGVAESFVGGSTGCFATVRLVG